MSYHSSKCFQYLLWTLYLHSFHRYSLKSFCPVCTFHTPIKYLYKYRRQGSNRRPTGYESVALPLSYDGICTISWNRTRLFCVYTQQFVCPHHLMTAFLLSRPITSDRHQFGVLYTPTVPYGEGFQEFRTNKETPIGFMCSTNCRGHRGDLNPILHAASVMCYQVTLPGP